MFRKAVLVSVILLSLVSAGCSAGLVSNSPLDSAPLVTEPSASAPVLQDPAAESPDSRPGQGALAFGRPADASSETVDGSPANEALPAAPLQGQRPLSVAAPVSSLSTVIVDTGQDACYGASAQEIACPPQGQTYSGQDAQYAGAQPSYVDNGDGTITDLNTGLMWQQSPDFNGDGQINIEDKKSYSAALQDAETFTLAGYNDWRLPTIKELYSLIDFSGSTAMSAGSSVPYIETDYFDFAYGDESAGERFIDAQFASSTLYGGTVFGGRTAMFGVNFADGRIKGYPVDATQKFTQGKTFYVLYVRGATGYGENNFVDNGDGTISDWATGLMWQASDSGAALDWASALDYCENLSYAGHDDWRLPNAKELQSIVDYSRAPEASDPAQRGPAIDPIFEVSESQAWYWTSTTHLDGHEGRAVYIAFGQAFGVYDGTLVDVHGAGAQRSDPKSGDASVWSNGNGPQNDQIRIDNYARCVRDGAQSVEVAGSGNSGQAPQTGGQPPASGAGQGTGRMGPQPGMSPQGGALGGPESGLGRVPPQAAIDACTYLSEDAACTFTSSRGQMVAGTCLPVQSVLACVPLGGLPADNP